MNIGGIATENCRTDYAGYEATGNAKIDNFYSDLSSAVEKSDTKATGDVLGLTMIPYSDMMSYGMAAYYSEDSTEADPIIRVQSNYGGEQRYYNVHVYDVDPKNASQLEMFALSSYLDDKGATAGGTFGSFAKMKTYAGNAAVLGEGKDLMNPYTANKKMDWISMLKNMAQNYLQCSQTYSQYLDCNKMASSIEEWCKSI